MSIIDTPRPTTACIESTAKSRANGYALVNRRGRGHSPQLHHRWTWEQAHGPIPDGLVVMHLCDNRLCIRLDHLALGTQGDNLRMAYRRGMSARGNSGNGASFPWMPGEAHPLHKLTDEWVREIRARWPGEGFRTLAREYGVTRTTIRCVVKRQTWKHVS